MRGPRHEGYIALVDDDAHSARLLSRALEAAGVADVCHLGGAEFGGALLGRILSRIDGAWPGLVVVDLKADSAANGAFVRRHQALLRQRGVALLVMINRHDQQARADLLDAGAAGVFYRQADREAYRREVHGILEFQARHARLDAVGM